MNFAAIDLGILAPAFLAGLLVLSTHVPLGAQVLRKGIVFIDLAIAQIAALGVVVAGLFDVASNGWQMQAAAAAAALAGAFLLNWTERKWPQVQEAQIGVVFVLAATAGILLLSKNPHGGEHLRDLLAGQILWVSYARLVIPLVATSRSSRCGSACAAAFRRSASISCSRWRSPSRSSWSASTWCSRR